MKKYYIVCSNNKKVQTASAQIPWSHSMQIIDKIKSDNERIWYMNETFKNGWSYDILFFQMQNDLYSRQVLNEKLNNFNNALIEEQRESTNNMIKDPYIFDFLTLRENYMKRNLKMPF